MACKAYFICGTTFSSEEGTEELLTSNFVKARALLKEAQYDGTPVVLLHSTDLNVLANLAPVARQLLERAGFTVDLQSMDWQTLVTRRTKKDAPHLGGWHGFLTATFGAELLDPAISSWLTSNCDKALPGWPCDAQLEALRGQFARQLDPLKQQAVAREVQVRARQVTPYVPLGQWYSLVAARSNITGFLTSPTIVFWNIEKS